MEEQTKKFKKKSFLYRLKMPLAELEDYYCRKRHFDRNKEIRKMLYMRILFV